MEKVFGTLKRSYGYSRVRYRGLKRNRWRCGRAYNLSDFAQGLPEYLSWRDPAGELYHRVETDRPWSSIPTSVGQIGHDMPDSDPTSRHFKSKNLSRMANFK